MASPDARYAAEMQFLLLHATKKADDLGADDFAVAESFPHGPKGPVAKVNGLFRTNWFNGRFLTADAFRADQIYSDTRARMVAQIHPPGIAWGLTLDVREVPRPSVPVPPVPAQGSDDIKASVPAAAAAGVPSNISDDELERLCKMLGDDGAAELDTRLAELKISRETLVALCAGEDAPSPGLPLEDIVQLEPGLAFDDLGRPISVGATHEFTFAELVNRYRTKPTVVIGGGTAFAPCACVQVLPPEAVPPGVSLPEGPYLLLITPIEVPEGQARRTANPCAGSSLDGSCEAEGWRGGFEVSLARLQIQIPTEGWSNAWDLRGLLSGWYFDVYEHDLRSRWNRSEASAPYFPRELDTWQGPGPHARVDAGVPLALVYFGADGTVSFMDPWIPRRPIASTGSAAWAQNVRGAPTPSAQMARVHQFQTMLEESLQHIPHNQIDANGAEGYGPNLYERGFRHIPPWGLLPVRKPPATIGRDGFGSLLTDAEAIRQARSDAAAYFARTNVFVWGHVAIHDDDMLEDMLRADPKDPITLQTRPRTELHDQLVRCLGNTFDVDGLTSTLAGTLIHIVNRYGDVTIDQLVNRELDSVKLLVPMDPRRRSLAVVGQVSSDPLAGIFDTFATPSDTPTLDQLFAGLDCVPRRFVMYVKHRMVLLEVLYLALDLFLDLKEVLFRLFAPQIAACADGTDATDATGLTAAAAVSDTFMVRSRRKTTSRAIPLTDLRAATVPLRRVGSETARVLLDAPGVRSGLTTGLVAAFPELRSADVWSSYGTATSATERISVLDALSDEYAGFGVLKGVSLVLPDDLFADFVTELTVRAEADAPSLASATFHRDGYTTGTVEAELAGELKDAYARKPLTELVAAAPGAVRIEDVLDAPSAELSARLGSDDAETLTAAVTKDAQALLELAPKLAKSKALTSPEFFADLRTAREAASGDLNAGLRAMAKTTGSKTAARDLLKASETLGPDGTARLVERLELRAKSAG